MFTPTCICTHNFFPSSNFVTSKTIINCIQFSSCKPFRVGFRAWILHPSQQRCGCIPPSPPGLRNVGLRPSVLALLGSSWRRVPSRAAAKRSACARGRLLGRCCCVLQREFDGVREKEGIRTNALVTVKRNEKLSFFCPPRMWRHFSGESLHSIICAKLLLSRSRRG